MKLSTALPIAFALLAVVGLGLGAATVDSATGGDTGPDGTEETQLLTEDFGDAGTGDATLAIPLEVFAVLYLTMLVVGGYAVYRIYGIELYVLLGLAAVFSFVLIAVFQPGDPTGPTGLSPPETGDAPSAPDGEPRAISRPVGLYTALLLVSALVTAGYVFLGRRTAAVVDEDEEAVQTDDGESLAAVGRTAGETADRIVGQASADNAVFEAWCEMTDHLDLDHQRATPREFADAAVEAGMDREDVATLTECFETVRYGDEPITEDRATTARDALRRIERTYADDGGGV